MFFLIIIIYKYTPSHNNIKRKLLAIFILLIENENIQLINASLHFIFEILTTEYLIARRHTIKTIRLLQRLRT